jgi:N-acetylglutamate synthase-like GNAT family acetyltransferase
VSSLTRLSYIGVVAVILDAATEADMALVRDCVERFKLDGERLAPEQLVIARDGERVVAFGRIKPYQQVYELGTVGVLERERGKGYARLVVEELVRRFPTPEVWITTDRPEVFARLGFQLVERGPDEIQAKLERICGWKQNVVTMLREK